MSDPFVVSRIRQLSLCQTMTPTEVELLSGVFQVLRLAPDAIVFQQGQPSQGLYVFVYGSGVLLQSNANSSTRPVGMVEAGQYINENALFAVSNESATLRIVEPSVVLFLSRDSLRALIAQHPQLSSDINAYLRARSRASEQIPLVKPPSPAQPSHPSAPLVQPPPVSVTPPPSAPLVQPAPSVPRPAQEQRSYPAENQPPPPSAPLVQTEPAVEPRPTIQPAQNSQLPATPIQPPQVGGTQTPAPHTPVINPPPAPATPMSPSLPAQVSEEPLVPPQRVVFNGQRENEVVVAQVWRHWWAFARFAWAPLFMFIGLMLLSFVVQVPFLQAVFAGAAIFLPGVALLYLYREWRNDRLIITSERVLWIERRILKFETNVRELPIESILEVGADYPPVDPFSRMLDYGTLKLRTSGSIGNLTLDLMPTPRALQKQIFAARDEHKQVIARQQRNVIRAEMNQLIGGKDPKSAVTHVPPPIPEGFNPLRMRFVNTKGETVYRKHVSIWFQQVIPPLLLMFGGLALALWALTRTSDLRWFMLAMSAVPVIIGGLWLYWADWDWRNDMYMVGDERITLIHQRPLWLQNKVDTINLAQVDSVATDQQGFFNALLNRGDVRLSLEGADNPKKFEAVFKPQAIAAEISTRQANARQRQQTAAVQQQRQAVADYISVYHETINQYPAGAQPYRPPVGQQPMQPPRPTDTTRPPNVPKKQ